MFDITSDMISDTIGYIATIMSDFMPYLLLLFGLFAGVAIVSFILEFIEDARLNKRLEIAEKEAGIKQNN